MEEIVVRPIAECSMERVLALAATYYPDGDPVRRADYLEWLYRRNPNGECRLALALENDGSYVGMMALIPFRMTGGGATIDTIAVVHVLVHPKYRGRNLFVRMILAVNEERQRTGEWLIGHPNESATPGWRRTRMIFRTVDDVRIRLPLLSRSRRGGPRPVRLSDAMLALCDFSALDEWRCTLGSPALAVDREFLKWRFLDHPIHRYEIFGWLDGDRLLGYYVRRRFRMPMVWLAVDWQGADLWRDGPPGAWLSPTLVPWPTEDSTSSYRPRMLFKPRGFDRQFQFFATPANELNVNHEPWSYVTLAASDIG